MIRQRLAGKRVLITGVTGFLGQALLERLLTDVPDVRIALLVRPQGGTPARARVERLLGRPAFAAWRERVGEAGVERLLECVDVVEADVGAAAPELPGDLDVVFHCAATVSFDPPIDEGFQANLLGTVRLYEAVRASGSRAHLVHVSTAYVAGMRKGVVPEAPLDHRVDWREEADAALAARRAVEQSSRRPELLDRFVRESRKEHGRAGPQTVSDNAERRRRSWVSERLSDHGRARAQSLGWPDVYTLTKALGERAAEEIAGGDGAPDGRLPLSIVRPSIIESALRQPYPGWIEGFKMADPILLAYGRGTIPEFPGIPEGIVDIIPADMVTNAMVAAAAFPPEDGVAYYHVSSGARNPLTYHRLYELVRDYFRAHPLQERGRGELRVPEWAFPGRTRVERMLRTGERLLDTADRVVSSLPRSGRVREAVERVDDERRRLEFIRRYGDLYGAYWEAEVIYTDERTRALVERLDPDDRARFCFDATEFDWRHYIAEVHCPSITADMRRSTPRRAPRRTRLSPRSDGVVAVFDMEGTILTSNVVESYLWLRFADLPRSEWPAELAAVLRSLPRYLASDRRDRGEFLRAFYRRYEGAAASEVRRLLADDVSDLLLRRASPAAIRRVREHRAAGHRTVLITGALEAFVEPLRPLFDEVVAARPAVRDGRYTGFLDRPPLVGEARAAWLRQYASSVGGDLFASYAYGDSHSDLPLLRAVGNPVAVNPDVALYRVARSRSWPVERWRHSGGTPRVLVPGSDT